MEESAMCEKACPKCGSEAHVTSFVSLIFSFELWDFALVIATVVWVVGMYQTISNGAILFFALLAALPVLTVVQRKEFCEFCQIEFISKPFRASATLPSQAKK